MRPQAFPHLRGREWAVLTSRDVSHAESSEGAIHLIVSGPTVCVEGLILPLVWFPWLPPFPVSWGQWWGVSEKGCRLIGPGL